MTGIATAIYENQAIEPPADIVSDHRRHIRHQLAGALEGTYHTQPRQEQGAGGVGARPIAPGAPMARARNDGRRSYSAACTAARRLSMLVTSSASVAVARKMVKATPAFTASTRPKPPLACRYEIMAIAAPAAANSMK